MFMDYAVPNAVDQASFILRAKLAFQGFSMST